MVINESTPPLDEGKPVVSFILCAYNQEKYIEAAIKGAFSQTYSPLDIILTDDCSTDSTFSIMEKMAENYQGEHRVRLNRNSKNRGISANFTKAVSMSRGEFIIGAAGDDIFLPTSTQALAGCWLHSGKQTLLVHANAQMMDKQGQLLDEIRRPDPGALTSCQVALRKNAGTIGAVTGYSARLFTEFPPIDPKVVHEDRVLPIRALLLSNIGYVDKVLIHYRVGGISYGYDKTSFDDYLFNLGNTMAQRYVEDYRQKVVDLQFAGAGKILINIAEKKQAEWELIAQLGKKRKPSLSMIKNSLRQGVKPAFVIKNTIKYLLPTLYHTTVTRIKEVTDKS